MPRYFLTGATGFIGGHLARQLLERGHQVVALVRDPAKAQPLAQRGAQLVPGDITDKESVREGMRGADGVFHLAAWYRLGARDSSVAQRINVDGTRNVLELALELGVPKAVYTSTLAVNSDTQGREVDESYRFEPGAEGFISAYDRSKWLAHYRVAEPLRKRGLPLVIVLPGVVYGPGDPSAIGAMFRRYLQGKLPVVPLKTAYSWGYVEDIAEAHRLAMDKGELGESYIIAGPTHTLSDALELAERISGVRAPRLRAPPALLKGLARVAGVLGRFAPLPETYHPEMLRASAGVTYIGSNAKARRDLAYAPRALEQGLTATLHYEMAQLAMLPPRSDGPVQP